MKENGCYSCGAETFNACGCEDKDAETYEAQFSSSTTFKGKWENGVTRKIDDVDVTKVSWNKYVVEYKGCLGFLEDADIGEGYWLIRFVGEQDDYYIELYGKDYDFNGDWHWLWKKIGRNPSEYTAYTTKATHWKEGALRDFKVIVDRIEGGQHLIRNVFTSRSENFGAEGGEIRTGAMYGAGAVVGITGATMVLGALMSLFSRRS